MSFGVSVLLTLLSKSFRTETTGVNVGSPPPSAGLLAANLKSNVLLVPFGVKKAGFTFPLCASNLATFIQPPAPNKVLKLVAGEIVLAINPLVLGANKIL